jgi:hypothetical protein
LWSHEAKSVQMWLSVDPLAEKYYTLSPYNYAGNIPTRFIDYDGKDFGISFKNGAITISQTWYHDSKDSTEDLLQKAIDYINSNSGKYGVQTKNGDIIPVNFEINFSNKEDVTYDDGFINNHSKNQDLARKGGTANYMSLAGMELVNSCNAKGIALEGGDDTKYYYDANDNTGNNADAGTVGHEIMHTLGMSHSAIGKIGTNMTKDGIGGMLLYASKNGKNINIKLSNIIQNAYLGSPGESISKGDKPSVINTDNNKIKLSGTIVEIK